MKGETMDWQCSCGHWNEAQDLDCYICGEPIEASDLYGEYVDVDLLDVG